MTLTAEAQVQTDNASGYLAELCRHFDEKAKTQPELGVRVEWTETEGTVDFGWGRCTMRADGTTLLFRAEAADDDGLRQVQELVSRHVESHGEAEQLSVTWPRGASATDTHADRRDAMRAFHRRMRH